MYQIIIVIVIVLFIIWMLTRYEHFEYNYDDLTRDIQIKVIKQMQADYAKNPTKMKSYLLKQAKDALDVNLQPTEVRPQSVINEHSNVQSPESKRLEIEEKLRGVPENSVDNSIPSIPKKQEHFDDDASVIHELHNDHTSHSIISPLYDELQINESFEGEEKKSNSKSYILPAVMLLLVLIIGYVIFKKI